MEKTFGQNVETNNDVSPSPSQSQSQPQDETSVAVANLTSILERPESTNSTPGPINNVIQKRSDDELQRSAGEILHGVKRTVEVQVVNPDDTFDFPNQTILGKRHLLRCGRFRLDEQQKFHFFFVLCSRLQISRII